MIEALRKMFSIAFQVSWKFGMALVGSGTRSTRQIKDPLVFQPFGSFDDKRDCEIIHPDPVCRA